MFTAEKESTPGQALIAKHGSIEALRDILESLGKTMDADQHVRGLFAMYPLEGDSSALAALINDYQIAIEAEVGLTMNTAVKRLGKLLDESNHECEELRKKNEMLTEVLNDSKRERSSLTTENRELVREHEFDSANLAQ